VPPETVVGGAPSREGSASTAPAQVRGHGRWWNRLGAYELGAALLGLAFIVITAWWLSVDQGTPDGDAGRHLQTVFDFHGALRQKAELHWFRYEPATEALYPPLVFLVGVLGTVVSFDPDGPVLALNVLTVPLLVAGTYGVAAIAFGRRAGLLAVVFVLAAPIAIGQYHIFLFDMALTAFVAASAALLLASDRFASRPLSLAAGVAVGLGLMTKQSFPIFIAPLVALLLARGGWRNWVNFALFAGIALVIALPWYLEHFDRLRGVATAATGQSGGIDSNPYGTEYERFSLDNFAWYGWTFMNLHYFLPLTLFFLVGLVHTTVSWVRTRSPAYAPELIVGSLSGYVGVALVLGFQDARYSFPAAVFVAALGVGWMTRCSRRVQVGAIVALALVLVLNTIAVNTGAFGRLDLQLGGEQVSVAGENKLVVIADHGYTSGRPETARLENLLESAKRDGVDVVGYEHEAPTLSRLNPGGLMVLARTTGMALVHAGDPQLQTRRGIYLVRRERTGGVRPCERFSDGSALFALRGGTGEPLRSTRRYCPS
jgi:hypothetical protein